MNSQRLSRQTPNLRNPVEVRGSYSRCWAQISKHNVTNSSGGRGDRDSERACGGGKRSSIPTLQPYTLLVFVGRCCVVVVVRDKKTQITYMARKRHGASVYPMHHFGVTNGVTNLRSKHLCGHNWVVACAFTKVFVR